MKRVFVLLAVCALLGACEQMGGSAGGGKVSLKTKMDTISYALGVDIGKNFNFENYQKDFSQWDMELNVELLKAGLISRLNEQAQLSDTVVQEVSARLNQEIMAQRQIKAAEAKKKGDEYLAANKSKEGVQTTASGLQYKVLKEGTGTSPIATDKVKVHYTGRLVDGKVFDSSVERGTPAEFGVGAVIPGWTEGLQLMKEGAKYEFYIPSNLGYGERGSQGAIGPNEALVFEVELLEILK